MPTKDVKKDICAGDIAKKAIVSELKQKTETNCTDEGTEESFEKAEEQSEISINKTDPKRIVEEVRRLLFFLLFFFLSKAEPLKIDRFFFSNSRR